MIADCRLQIADFKSAISNLKFEISDFKSIGLFIAAILVSGCASPEARVQRIQGEKDELLATIRQQRDANRALNTQVASLEKRLDQAETQLAGGTPRQLTQQSAANRSSLVTSKQRVQPKPQEPAEEPLNWRPHRASAQPNTTLPLIAQLAREDDRVEVDAETGTGVWVDGVSFEPNTSALTSEGRQQLAELAKVLTRAPASKFRVLVATSAERTGSRTQAASAKSGRQLAAARAQSVADYLDRHGIAEDRLAVASTGVRKSARDEHGRPTTSADDVRIYLVDPDQRVLGWLSPETIRR
jgi:outer membrane protein OmpA-like peptidoglycan-associated protein